MRPPPPLRRAPLGAAALLAVLAAGACAPSAPVAAAPAPAADARASLARFVDSLAGAPEWRNAHWGILIVDPERGDTLYSRNAGVLFMPASNQKLLTGAVALARLGPDYRFRTDVGVRRRGGAPGAAGDSLVAGRLVVTGYGDPTVSDHAHGDAMLPLRAMADSLRARGIRAVDGGVTSGGDALPGPILGFGWSWDDLDYPYSAGVDELLLNEGFSVVRVRGGAAAGEPATVVVHPERSLLGLDTRVRTAAAGTRHTLAFERGEGDAMLLAGSIAAGDSARLTITHRRPAAAYLRSLEAALAERGVVLGRTPTDTGAVEPLFSMHSPPLRTIMPLLQKPSQNQIAELLYRTLGRELTGVGTPDSGRVVVERQLLAWGAERDGFIVRDGSGLSRHNYVSPETIVRVLAAMRRDSAFTVFHDALPIAGVDGTIAGRMKGTAAQGNVRAKTGYIDRARSLSGYVTTADGTPLLFAMLANNWSTTVRDVERVQDAIAVRLAELRLRDAAAAAGTAPAGR